jgi:hypothetical protein
LIPLRDEPNGPRATRDTVFESHLVTIERARDYPANSPPELRSTAKRESPQFTGGIIAALYDSDHGCSCLDAR